MIKLFIVSNTKHKELTNFLEQRGTFSVVGSYNSISENSLAIQNDVLKVDKTLYLYQTSVEGINIRSDMQYLQKMIETNSFFNPGEILFMTQNNELGQQAIKYFMSVMNSCGYKKYTIKTSENTISYMDVYDNLMGVSQNADFYNKYRVLYRREAEEESTTAYEPKDSSKQLIEPFNLDVLKEYESQKSMVNKATTNVKVQDEEFELKRYENPVFQDSKIQSVLAGPNVYVITGRAKSGLSTWASALAASSVAGSRNTIVIDLTKNQGVKECFEQNEKEFQSISMKQVLLEEKEMKSEMKILVPGNKKEEQVKLMFLQKIFDRKIQIADNVIVAAECSDFANVCEILKGKISKVFITVNPRFSDVKVIQEWVSFLRDESVMVILNDCVSLNWEEKVNQESVKKTLALINPKVLKSINFENLDVGEGLFSTIVNA